MRPAPIDNSGKDKVCTEVPELEVGRDGSECRSRNGKVWVVHKQRASNHGHQHDSPVWEGLVGKMRQDDLGSHASEDQRHGQTVQDKVVVFKQVRVWRTQPGHRAHDKHDQGSPLVDQW